jgi:hypothetical protein
MYTMAMLSIGSGSILIKAPHCILQSLSSRRASLQYIKQYESSYRRTGLEVVALTMVKLLFPNSMDESATVTWANEYSVSWRTVRSTT